MTDAASSPNADQIDYWNASAGMTWSRFQTQIDAQLAPLGHAAMAALAPLPGERILDVGCGCGETTLDLAHRVGSDGMVLGLDISAPMLDAARQRPVPDGSARPDFRMADAQTATFPPDGFDALFSRFGVMFFADPSAAFANLRRGLRTGGRLGFVCWRPYDENVWMKAPMEAALAVLPPRPPVDPLAPGPYAFADPERVRRILADAGFSDIAIEPFDTLVGQSNLDDALQLALRLGPLGRALIEMPDKAAEIQGIVRAELARFVGDDGLVRMPAAVWIVTAKVG